MYSKMKALFVLFFFALLCHVGYTAQLSADNGERIHVKMRGRSAVNTSPRSLDSKPRGRSLFNVFNLQSLFDDKSETVEVRDDEESQPGRVYFNLFTSIFSGEREESPPETTRVETRAPTMTPVKATVEISETNTPTSMPVSAEEVTDAAMDFLSVFPADWKPQPQGSYSSIFLSIFAPREPPPPTVSPAPSMSVAPSDMPTAPPSVSPTLTIEPPSAFPSAPTVSPSQVPTSFTETALPSEVASQSPSVVPGNSSVSPTTVTVSPSEISGNPTSAPSIAPTNLPSSTPTGDSTLLSDIPSLVPSFAESGTDSSTPPSVSSSSLSSSDPTSSIQPSTLPSSSIPPTTPIVEGAFSTVLNLDEVPENYRIIFTAAATRWDSIITGDLEDFVLTEADRGNAATRCNPAIIPDVVDDVFICASLPEIDGPVGILGTAGPLLARNTDFVQTALGYMQFDLADVEILNQNGQLAGTILHEMAHVYGIGTLWLNNNLVEDTAACPYRYDSRASEEYRTLSGCDASVPIETDGGAGTVCLHWDEDCFQSELMTGVNTGGQELSRVTIAGLEDLGYQVNYNQATPFSADLLSPSCVCNANGNSLSETSLGNEKSLRSEASEIARQKAIDFGRASLKSNRSALLKASSSDHSIYLGDKVIIVLYWDDNQVESVIVTADN